MAFFFNTFRQVAKATSAPILLKQNGLHPSSTKKNSKSCDFHTLNGRTAKDYLVRLNNFKEFPCT